MVERLVPYGFDLYRKGLFPEQTNWSAGGIDYSPIPLRGQADYPITLSAASLLHGQICLCQSHIINACSERMASKLDRLD
jgi:hypothetical protein